MARIDFLQDASLTETVPTAYQLVSEGVQRRMKGVHQQAIVRINAQAKDNFANAIERPMHSATRGDGPYGRNRVSGKFTFGSNLTFIGKLIDKSTIQGFGYPDVNRADQRTQGVWRFLEEGDTYTIWPKRALFFDGGRRVPAERGRDDVVRPGVGPPVKFENKVIKPRRYIADAVENVRTSYLEPAYERILDQALKDA